MPPHSRCDHRTTIFVSLKNVPVSLMLRHWLDGHHRYRPIKIIYASVVVRRPNLALKGKTVKLISIKAKVSTNVCDEPRNKMKRTTTTATKKRRSKKNCSSIYYLLPSSSHHLWSSRNRHCCCCCYKFPHSCWSKYRCYSPRSVLSWDV